MSMKKVKLKKYKNYGNTNTGMLFGYTHTMVEMANSGDYLNYIGPHDYLESGVRLSSSDGLVWCFDKSDLIFPNIQLENK